MFCVAEARKICTQAQPRSVAAGAHPCARHQLNISKTSRLCEQNGIRLIWRTMRQGGTSWLPTNGSRLR